MSELFYNSRMRVRTLILAALALFCTACTEPAVPRYQLSSPTTPSPVPTPTPNPTPPTSTPAPLSLVFAIGPSNPVAGVSAAFVTTVTPAPSAPVAYTWSFGDGVNEQTGGGTTFHTYSRAGGYEASVNVADALGRTVVGNAHVSVQSPPPPPAPDPVPTTPVGYTVTLSCTTVKASLDASCNVTAFKDGAALPSAKITNVAWDWGDGVPDLTTLPARTHPYTVPGTFTVFAVATVTGAPSPITISRTVTVPGT